MEHLRTTLVAVPLGDPHAVLRILDHRVFDGRDFAVGLTASEALQRRERIGNACAWPLHEEDQLSAENAAVRLASALRSGRVPEEAARDIGAVLRGLGSILGNVRRRLLRPGTDMLVAGSTTVTIECEQVPNPDSRITLSDECDVLGQPKARVHWQLLPQDLHTTRTMVDLVTREFATRLRVRLIAPSWVEAPLDSWQQQFRDVAHHLGTARMAALPKDGVTDPDGRVHGTTNLYVAGGAVFPTGGHVNPTLTIVALASRLAHHLRSGEQR